MIQFRFNLYQAKDMLRQLGYEWELDPTNAKRIWVHQTASEWAWNYNLTRLIDELTNWCHNSGIQIFAFGYTQIELCVTFQKKSDAALFKLRWYNV